MSKLSKENLFPDDSEDSLFSKSQQEDSSSVAALAF
jgi:hypothetical protein